MTDVPPLRSDDPESVGGYRLEGRLGEGGQGVVYLGRDESGGRAAVKVLRVQLAADPEMRERFARELAVIERIAGFCTAQVLDADIDGDRPYIASEYVPGPPLKDVVTGQGPRTGTDLDRLAVATATALAAIHRAGVVHRDFKPANVLMGPDGPRVIDFGISRVLEGSAKSATASGVVGTPAYMAPEQVTGGRIGPPADIFAWAATMTFAATGRAPFAGTTIPEVMHRITTGEPDLSGVPQPLAELLGRCLAKDPALRPGAEEIMALLLGDRHPSTTPEQPPLWPIPEPEPRKSNALLYALVAGAVVVALALTAAIAYAVWPDSDGAGGTLKHQGKLKAPLLLQPVRATNPAPCKAGQVPDYAGRECFGLGPGFTVTTVKEIEVRGPGQDTGATMPVVAVTLEPDDGRRFEALSRTASAERQRDPTSPGASVAVVVDGRVAMAPQITEPLTGGVFQIHPGTDGAATAKDLFTRLTGR